MTPKKWNHQRVEDVTSGKRSGVGWELSKQPSSAHITQETEMENAWAQAACQSCVRTQAFSRSVSRANHFSYAFPASLSSGCLAGVCRRAHLPLLKQTHPLAPLECRPAEVPICLCQRSLGPALGITNTPPAASNIWAWNNSSCTLTIQIMSLDQEND